MKSKFKRKDKVQSVHYGQGTVVKVESDQAMHYPVKVVFGTIKDGLVRYYTRDGKYTVNEISDKDITKLTEIAVDTAKLPFRVGSRVQHRTIEEIKGEIVRILDNGADYPVLILWDKDKNAVGLFNHEGTPYSISTDIQGKSWSKDEDPTVNLIQC